MIAFVATYAFLAWLNPRDAAHHPVTDYLKQFRGKLLTTEWVLIELADALCAPASRGEVIAFLRSVRSDPQFEVVGYDADVFRDGMNLFEARPDKSWSLTDCISFAAMSARELVDALTADHHFEQAGFHAIFRK